MTVNSRITRDPDVFKLARDLVGRFSWVSDFGSEYPSAKTFSPAVWKEALES